MKTNCKISPQLDDAKSINFVLIGLVTLLVARPLVPEDPGGQAGYGVAFIMLWLLLVASWIAEQWRSNQVIARPDLADFLMLGLVGWHTLAALVAVVQGSPRPAVNLLWEWVGIGLTFVLARRIISTGAVARGIIAVMVGLAVGFSLVAVEQRFFSMPFDRQVFEQARHDPAKLYELTGQWLPPGSAELARFENRLESQQPSATFALTNSLAGFLVPWSLLLAVVLFDGQFWPTAGWARFAGGVLALTVIAMTLVLTGSRTAIVSVVAGVTAIGALRGLKLPHRRFLLKVFGVFIVLVSGGAILGITSGVGRDVLGGAARSLAFRADYWLATWRMIEDRPLLGWGPGQFQDSYTRYKLPTASEEIQDPHNWLLEITANAGVPAGVLLLALLFVIACRLARPHALENDTYDREVGTQLEGLTGAACGLVLGQVLAFTNGFPSSPRQLALIALGIAAAWWVLRPWIRAGKLDPIAVLIAAAAMLLNLTAAGGIGYPSIAESLWLLAAIGLCLKGGRRDEAVNTTTGSQQAIRFALITTCVALLAAAYVSSYGPVTTSRAWLARADAEFLSGQVKRQAAAVEAAMAADRWSAYAARRVVALRFANYQQETGAERLATVMDAVDRMLDLSPRKSGAWQYASEVAETIFRESGERQWLDSAIRYQRQAIERYPTSSQLHSRLANLLQEAEDHSAATDAAREGLRLDELMRSAGHADRRLSLEEQKKLREIAGEKDTFDAEKP